MLVPSSVVELVLPHQIASLIRGGAKAGPCRKEELCPSGTPRSDVEALTPPKDRSNSPWKRMGIHRVKGVAEIKQQEQSISKAINLTKTCL